MTYSIIYNDGLASVTQETRGPASTRIEIFPTEGEALSRASRLLDEGTHQAISVCDGSRCEPRRPDRDATRGFAWRSANNSRDTFFRGSPSVGLLPPESRRTATP
jgi:hypothetical protein